MSQPFADGATSQAADELFAKLTPVEIYWRDKQEFFESCGYMLRPRYRPSWTPSWRADRRIDIYQSEDYLSCHSLRPHLMDARRISDNKLVLMKKIRSDSDELRLATYFSSNELRQDPRNHCVPVLDVLVDPEDPAVSFLVMPYLRYIDEPQFDTVESILDCCEQLFQGLAFLHEHNIAHRDCAYKNVMMDAVAMYPQSFHPMAEDFLPDDIVTLAPVLPRSNVQVSYYFVDFGISTQFASNDNIRLVTGGAGLDQQVPELSRDVPYDPFKVDIFILGNLFKQSLFEKFSNVDMLVPLIRDMINIDPSSRPSAADALQSFQVIRRSVPLLHRHWRAKPRGEPLGIQAINDSFSLCTATYRSLF